MFKEFKQFAIKGNIIDLATGVIIGGAFGKIVTSLVNDVIMPLIGLLIGGINFTSLHWTLRAAQGDQPALILQYGMFMQSVVDFLIVAFSIFLFIRAINKFKSTKSKEAPGPTKEQILLTEIRDLLKEKHE